MTVTTGEKAPHTLTIERTIAAPRSIVWQCWTDPTLLQQWFCPSPWKVPEADFDLCPGGRMNTVMAGPDGERFDNQGIWLEIVPETRLVFTDAFTEGYMPTAEPFMTGTVDLSDLPNGSTRLYGEARHGTAEQKQKHLEMGFVDGWTASTAQLATLAEQLSKGETS